MARRGKRGRGKKGRGKAHIKTTMMNAFGRKGKRGGKSRY